MTTTQTPRATRAPVSIDVALQGGGAHGARHADMSETGGDAPAPPAAVGAPPRPRVLAPRRISRGNLWGILQGRLHVPMGDLRRQFQIDSDDVTPIQTPEGTYYVGLPADGAAVLGQLWHEGRIVFDCTPDLSAMVVRAIAPTRPTRPYAAPGRSGAPATTEVIDEPRADGDAEPGSDVP